MIGWFDATAGAAGDMLLAAVVAAGADEAAVASAVDAVAPERVGVSFQKVRRAGLVATQAVVEVADSSVHRGLSEVLQVLDEADLDADVRRHARDVFGLLADAEAAVHGVSTDEVHFHEVGALDAIVDVVGVCAGLVSLGCQELSCSQVAVGSGWVDTDHGRMSVPPPAVVALLTGIPTYAGPAAAELCTPTGAALLRHWVTAWGAQPPMTVTRAGTGAGGREFTDHANVLRLLLGEPTRGVTTAGTAVVFESNIDDLDPRLWPVVLSRLFDAGASDAWLTPILMKKGRPAHTLSVLVSPEHAARVRATIFAETSGIGVREISVGKRALERSFTHVDVGGQPVAVKVARSEGRVVNVQPEFDDVVTAAAALGRPVKSVLAEASAAAAPGWRMEQLR